MVFKRFKREVPMGMAGHQICRARKSDEIPWYRVTDPRFAELPRPVALVNGAFDILHAGHMRLIFEAADRARSVIVALDSDGKVERLKGALPYLPWTQRALPFKYMPVSGLVEIGDDGDFRDLVRCLRPDFRVLSTEYIGRVSRVPEVPVIYVPERGPHSSDLRAKLTVRGIL